MSAGSVGRRWIFQKQFDGAPKDDNLKLEEFNVPAINDGEMLLEAVSLSVDPYMRLFSFQIPIGATMIGDQVARVVESKNPAYSVGTVVLASCGWTTHSVSDGSGLTRVDLPADVPQSLALGALGMPGVTAYFGLIDLCAPKAGETVMVSGAAGAVGNSVGQIAKILGCRVVGSAGSDAKVAFLKELGFDDAFNYKTVPDLKTAITGVAPQGIDVYFDNVGGKMSSYVVNSMNLRGRVTSCGAISEYNAKSSENINVEPIWGSVIGKRLKIQGLVAMEDYKDKYPIAQKQIIEWIQQGKLKPKEYITNGFENMYTAFQELFMGGNTGKAVVNI